MRNMEDGQAAALGRAAIADARSRQGADAGDFGRRRVICGVLVGVVVCVAALVCFFVFVDTGSTASSSGTVKVATTPSPVAAPTPSPVVSATSSPTVSSAGATVTLGSKLWGTDFCDESDDFLSSFSTAAGDWSSSKCVMSNSDTWEPLALAWLDTQVSSACGWQRAHDRTTMRRTPAFQNAFSRPGVDLDFRSDRPSVAPRATGQSVAVVGLSSFSRSRDSPLRRRRAHRGAATT